MEHRFEQHGTFASSCYLHPGMNGAIVVGLGGAVLGAVGTRRLKPGRDQAH